MSLQKENLIIFTEIICSSSSIFVEHIVDTIFTPLLDSPKVRNSYRFMVSLNFCGRIIKMEGPNIWKTKPFALIIVVGILAIGLVNNGSLVYAYVTIASPTGGQQIPTGSAFNIRGTSTAANDTNHCVVSVIMNGIRPYQKTIPTGTNGTEDYTSWQFTGDPNYATVKLGQNKITAKYSCFPGSDTNNTQAGFVKYHSVNVTGIGQQQPQQTSSPLLPSVLGPSSNGVTTGNSGGKIVKEPAQSKIIK